jgi:hypothetical protein
MLPNKGEKETIENANVKPKLPDEKFQRKKLLYFRIKFF